MLHITLEEPWFSTLTKNEQSLLITGMMLYRREIDQRLEVPDYSFLIFPVAKAYEGFIKRYLLEKGLISKETYVSKRFRLGRSINPDVYPEQRDKWWLFDDMVLACGKEMAHTIWETWLEGRNRVFHFFPHKEQHLTFEQATAKMEKLLSTIKFVVECQKK